MEIDIEGRVRFPTKRQVGLSLSRPPHSCVGRHHRLVPVLIPEMQGSRASRTGALKRIGRIIRSVVIHDRTPETGDILVFLEVRKVERLENRILS